MRLTIATEEGTTFNIEVDASMELENVMALLEAESGIATSEQLLFYSGKELIGSTVTLQSFGVQQDEILLLRQKSLNNPTPTSVAGRDIASESETMRLQLLGDPQLMANLRQTFPDLAAAALSDPIQFQRLLADFSARQATAKRAADEELNQDRMDPYSVEAQRRIEEGIRQEGVLENMQSAMENMPESFGSVHMLYVETEVNGKPVKAFVDSGAQATIMSPSCAERCGIMRLLDTRFAGMARGVGTAKILGRVHSAQLKMGTDLFLQCSFTIMEGKDVDLLFGLDMLKRYQAKIDLEKDALIIQGREIRFLSEHELPKHSEEEEEFTLDSEGNPVPIKPTESTPNPVKAIASSSTPSTSFPGSGNSLSTPAATKPTSVQTPAANATSKHPEVSIQSIMNLGVGREEAISMLDAAGGSVDVAASLLFN